MLKYPHYNIAVQFGFSYFFGSLSGTLDSTFGDYQSSLPRQTCAQHAPVYVPQPTAPLNPLLASLNPYPLPSGIDHKSQPSQPLTKCESVAQSVDHKSARWHSFWIYFTSFRGKSLRPGPRLRAGVPTPKVGSRPRLWGPLMLMMMMAVPPLPQPLPLPKLKLQLQQPQKPRFLTLAAVKEGE